MVNRTQTRAPRGRRGQAGLIVGGLGWALLLLGLGFLASELVGVYMTGTYRPISAGEGWFTLDVGSLNLAQAVIQRYIHPFLWDPILASVLRWPAWSLFGGVGAFLVLAFPLGRR